MKPWSGLAAMMLFLAMVFYVAAMASSQWLETSTPGLQRWMGPYEFCVRDWKNQLHECRRVDDSCTAGFSDPIGQEFSGSDCNRTRTVRAFLILGLIFASLAFVLTWLGYNSVDDIMYRLPAAGLSLFASLCGLIAWAVWTSMAQQDFGQQWRYSWAYGLSLGAWLLNLAAPLACFVPSPVRDRKLLMGEAGAAHPRGSWSDMFRASWWTSGADWGERNLAERGGAATAAGYGPTGTGDLGRGAPAGTAYREEERRGGLGGAPAYRAEERGTYQYRESEPERQRMTSAGERERAERAAERERGYGYKSGVGETERERLERESRGGVTTGGSSTTTGTVAQAAKDWLGVGGGGGARSEMAPSTEAQQVV